MQSITHFIFGVIIQKYIESQSLDFWLQVIFIILLGILSHIILDAFSIVTYHPKEPKDTLFWKTFHLLELIVSIVFVIFYIQYWLGILASIIPDIMDWMIIRPLYWKKTGVKNYDISFFHKKIIDPTRQIFFFWLPDLREKSWATINELIIIALGLYILFTM